MADSATVARGVDRVDPSSVGTALGSGSLRATAGPDAATDPSTRGALTIGDKVGEKIAVRAALDVDDVVPYQSTIGSVLGGSTPGRALIGGDYPQASVAMDQTAPTVRMTIAVSWPSAIAQVCDRVRTHVADELDRLTGVRPGRVDVSVAQIIAGTAASSARVQAPTRNGFVELKAADE